MGIPATNDNGAAQLGERSNVCSNRDLDVRDLYRSVLGPTDTTSTSSVDADSRWAYAFHTHFPAADHYTDFFPADAN